MKAVLIFGPSAVGKMTVGAALKEITGYKLFHNHMVIELIYNFWGYGHPDFARINSQIRSIIFSELGRSEYPGVIFTYVWALDEPSDHEEVLAYLECMNVDPKDVLFVELEADQKIRLERNKSEFRLREKKSKNNIEESERFIQYSESRYRLNSNNDFFYPSQHIKINNTEKDPEMVARIIFDEMLARNFHLT